VSEPIKQDLSAQLTVFVISTDEPSITECLLHLERQDCAFTLKRIHNVAPMDRAFQCMLDECTTPVYVQVDADMLLHPWAIRTLYENLMARPPEVSFVCGCLWDLDVTRAIAGVKAYRHDVMKRYPYQSSLSCETNQMARMEADGFKYEMLSGFDGLTQETCFGVHFPSQTPELAFRRWQRLMQKYRRYSYMGWLSPHPNRIMEKFLASHDPLDNFKMMGMVAGLTGPIPNDGELDARIPNLDFTRVTTMLGIENEGPQEIILYLTDKCNMRCVFDGVPCMREAESYEGAATHESGVITPELLRYTLKRYPSINRACVCGYGEPMLHPQLEELIDVMREGRPSFEVGIITNGSLLESKFDMLEESGVNYITVSLNAATRERHEEVTSTKTWDRVLAGIRRMVSGKLVPCGLTYVVSRESIGLIPDYIKLANELGVAFMYLHNVLPHDAGFMFKSKVLTVDDQAALDAMHSLPGAEIVKIWPQVIDLKNPPPLKCNSPRTTMGIDGQGNVSPCRRVDPPSAKYGNIKDADVWHSPKIAALRLELSGDQPLQEMCRFCFGNWKG
jgi:MoaA/NifB/PqqE/SkfB family radical SAM enzyme